MGKRVKLLSTAAVAVFTLAAGQVSAQTAQPATNQPWMGGRMDTNLYIGASVGSAKYRNECRNVPGDCDEKDVGWKGLIGYQFHRHLAVEAGYFNFGRAEFNTNLGGLNFTGNTKARGFEVLAVGLLPLTQEFSLLAKIGAARTRVRSTTTVSDGITPIDFSATDHETNLTFGVGAQYVFMRHLAGRVEWQRYDNVGGDQVGKRHIDFLSAGLQARF